jgi:hypothetical protein
MVQQHDTYLQSACRTAIAPMTGDTNLDMGLQDIISAGAPGLPKDSFEHAAIGVFLARHGYASRKHSK